MNVKKHKIKIITLGCPKNIVDSEYVISQLISNNFEITDDERKADTVIINTCGFIEDAKRESIDIILTAIEKKNKGQFRNLIVAGCLSERYKQELKKEIPEVNKYFGSLDKPQNIFSLLKTMGGKYKHELSGERIITTPSHFAYIKISEGCDNPCSFCAIPIIRGRFVSKPLEKIVSEAKILASKKIKELILIGQDTTCWGKDVSGKRELSKVLSYILRIKSFEWIRLLYTYPAGFPTDIIYLMKNNKFCHYIDIPIQHISDKVLKSMRRGISKKNLISLLEKMRKEIPDIAIRTTIMVGYPAESEKEFAELLDFISEFEFDRLGVFVYSGEEGTDSFRMKDRIPIKEKLNRQKLIMERQREISLKLNRESVNKVFKVLIDRKENDYYAGRTYKDAPEIDQEILVYSEKKLKTGRFYNVKIFDYEDYDLFGVKI